jgi:hypothetical protein
VWTHKLTSLSKFSGRSICFSIAKNLFLFLEGDHLATNSGFGSSR